MPSDADSTGIGPVPDAMARAHAAAWQRIAQTGSWWTGAQRVAFAGEVRRWRALRDQPPWARDDPGPGPGAELLPTAALEVARRIAIEAHRLDRAWCERMTGELGDAAYVELVGVAVVCVAIDAFAEALGVPLADLPEPALASAEPDRVRPDGLGDAGAWVQMTDPFTGPNVARALSLAPGEQMSFVGLVGHMYAVQDFFDLVWTDRALTRPQVELVAARVSAINECFY